MNRRYLSNLKTAVYRKPRDEIRRLKAWGAGAYFNLSRWKQQMDAAAGQLPRLRFDGEKSIEVWFLTGRDFWYQTAFCAWSLAHHSGRNVVLNIIDDGTLSAVHEAGLRRLFPEGVTLSNEDVVKRLDERLPDSQFPWLRKRWTDYVNIRKLIDIHLGQDGAKLVMDSDMLFFAKPDQLLSWYDNCLAQSNDSEVCLMTDCVESYGYSRDLMEKLAGTAIPSLLNVGVCGMRSEQIGWAELEVWCRELHENEGTCYYLEQALVAMMAARLPRRVLDASDYITCPTAEQVDAGAGVLQHYVANSKPHYFGNAWKQVTKIAEDYR